MIFGKLVGFYKTHVENNISFSYVPYVQSFYSLKDYGKPFAIHRCQKEMSGVVGWNPHAIK